MYQLVTFKAISTCIVESIKLQDLKELEKRNADLRDTLKQLEIDILNGEKSNFDYFRYLPERKTEIP
jgi:hypothetical protein